jgi:hypothetical protein
MVDLIRLYFGSSTSIGRLSTSFREFNTLGSSKQYNNERGNLRALGTGGKNVDTEVKCHALVPLDDIVNMFANNDCIPEVSFCLCSEI